MKKISDDVEYYVWDNHEGSKRPTIEVRHVHDYTRHVALYQSEAAELWPILKEFAETGEVKGE